MARYRHSYVLGDGCIHYLEGTAEGDMSESIDEVDVRFDPGYLEFWKRCGRARRTSPKGGKPTITDTYTGGRKVRQSAQRRRKETSWQR